MQFDKVFTEGIARLTREAYATRKNWENRIKLLGITRRTSAGIECASILP